MANSIQVIINRRPGDYFVPPSSRYADSTPIYYGDNNIMTYKIYKRVPFVPSPNDKFMVVTPGTEFRPDKISLLMYGVSDYWYRIMEANNIFDVFDLKAGRNIRLPASPTRN